MISIVVPYRDRPEHLAIFLKAMQTIKQDIEIIIVEQTFDSDFNRGKLLNIGAIYANGSQLIFHDVDCIPEFDKYPINPNFICQLKRSDIQKIGYFGGVTSFPGKLFWQIGGYSNNFYSRAEDNEMRFNVQKSRNIVMENFMPFRELDHARHAVEFDPVLWEKAKQPRASTDGIHNTVFEKISSSQQGNVLFIEVSI